jgi:ubiquinone/menaquinone biosynthesis C-methylase UbiE
MNHDMLNNYKNTAHLYDLDNRNIIKDDISFYIKQAGNKKGEILEIACGTGRVTIPLAREGFKVDGFDLSLDMINEFKEKLNKESPEVQKRITLFQADMTEFSINKKYPLIIIPFRAFQLLTLEDQTIKCLASIYKHLTDDGIFIINVYKPYTHLDETWVQPEKEDWTKTDLNTGITIRRTNIKKRIDVINQINYPELIYYVTDANGKQEKFIEKLAMKYYYEDQLRELLLVSRFKIVEECGYYDERPIHEGPELIFICKK